MILALAIVATLAGSVHTIEFEEVPLADHYLVHWKTLAGNPYWTHEPQVCESSPCRIWLRRPAAGNVVYVNVTAVARISA